jgi:hypothetical protein
VHKKFEFDFVWTVVAAAGAGGSYNIRAGSYNIRA